jgi:hypothetical protein
VEKYELVAENMVFDLDEKGDELEILLPGTATKIRSTLNKSITSSA